ncbi:hypothetical protein [Mycolicibacterium sp.]|uniref:hypothetical protein n=1 Tax=Mycolicibacterium sp. TaxID=2320850 RepID=UPI00355F47C4
MSAPIATAPVAAAPAPVAAAVAAPVAAPVAAAPAPVAAPVAAPAAAPAPVAAPAAAPAPVAAPAAVPTGLPPTYGSVTAAPAIGTIANSSGGGIPDEHFNKPLLFRLLSVGSRMSKYEKAQVDAPTVDYLVLDPATGQITEIRNVTIMQKNIRTDLVTSFQRGERAITGVATTVPTSNDSPAKVLKALDDQNSGYGAEQATAYLRDAAINTFGWWSAS